MDYLPIRINGQQTYAGFWRRFWASIIDCLIIGLFWFIFVRRQFPDKIFAIVITVAATALMALYNVFFNARYGGSLGKLAVQIRITKPEKEMGDVGENTT